MELHCIVDAVKGVKLEMKWELPNQNIAVEVWFVWTFQFKNKFLKIQSTNLGRSSATYSGI